MDDTFNEENKRIFSKPPIIKNRNKHKNRGKSMKISNLKIKHITTPKEGKTIILTITTIFLLTILSFAYHHINNNSPHILH